jgi:hypothetical protein
VLRDDLTKNINPDISNYLQNVDIEKKIKLKMFYKLLSINYWRINNLEHKIKIINDKLGGINSSLKKPLCPLICKSYEIITKPLKKESTSDTTRNIKSNTSDKQKTVDIMCVERTIDVRRATLLTNKTSIESVTSQIKIECCNKHIFQMTYENLKEGKWCYYCNNSRCEFITRKICEKIFNKDFKKIRPDWLKNASGKNLELDIFNEELMLAFEYNGEQHYKFNKYHHKNEKEFEELQERDKLKKKLCSKNEVTLIIIPFTVDEKEIYDFIRKQLDDRDIEFNNPKKSEISDIFLSK